MRLGMTSETLRQALSHIEQQKCLIKTKLLHFEDLTCNSAWNSSWNLNLFMFSDAPRAANSWPAKQSAAIQGRKGNTVDFEYII